MKEYIVNSLAQTQLLAEKLADKIEGKKVCILLKGDLGAGKTTFTKELGRALGVTKVMNSPTFTILKSYQMKDHRTLYHIDAYRLEGITQDLGFEEVFDEDAICVVEWPHFIQACLPNSCLTITIKVIDDNTRSFEYDFCSNETKEGAEE